VIAQLRDGVKPLIEGIDAVDSVHLGDAADDDGDGIPVPPYVVLEFPGSGRGDEESLTGAETATEGRFRVKAVAGTPEGAGILLGLVRAVLSPDGAWAAVPIDGHRVEVVFERSEFVTVDRDVTIPQTNRHPGIGVDTYRLVSQPTA
jgi:hypothetical protein